MSERKVIEKSRTVPPEEKNEKGYKGKVVLTGGLSLTGAHQSPGRARPEESSKKEKSNRGAASFLKNPSRKNNGPKKRGVSKEKLRMRLKGSTQEARYKRLNWGKLCGCLGWPAPEQKKGLEHLEDEWPMEPVRTIPREGMRGLFL